VEDRDRYRAEFLAELHGQPPGDQLRYAAGLLGQSRSLRAALCADPRRIEENEMTAQTPLWRSFRCHVLRIHYWRTMSNPDGERYRACAVCHVEHNSQFAPPPVA
jgi:hypothetical protein